MSRPSPAALAGVLLLCLLGQTSGSAVLRQAVAQPRTAFVSDVDGDYTSTLQLDNGCPTKVTIAGTVGDNGGIGRTPVENIQLDGVACSGGTMLTISETKARKLDELEGTAGLAGFAGNLRKNGAALTAVNQQQTTEVLVGNDDRPRTCGGTSWGEDTFYLFVKEGAGQEIRINTADGVRTGKVPAGQKGLFIVSNDKRLCLLSAEATKVKGEDSSEAAGAKVDANGSPIPTDDESDASSSPDASDEDDAAADATASDEDDDEDNGSACFPEDATVQLHTGAVIPVADLVIGDRVNVAPGLFSPVFMFTHKLADTTNSFVVITTASGASLSLTPGHYLYADGALVAAASVRPGARVVRGDGSEETVVSVGRRTARGLYNPQTLHGNVVVNGIVSSTYTTAVEPAFAHAVLSPFRLMHALGLRFTGLESGGGALADVAPRGARAEL